jgi:hypothetical protein
MNKYLLGVILTLGCLPVRGGLHVETGLAGNEALQSQNVSQPLGVLEVTNFPGSLIGMQYETWFTHGNATWNTAEAVPILGKYSSYDAGIIRKHAAWFNELGINWLLVDWSNMLWMKPDWEQHTGATRELKETTELLFNTYSQLNREGEPTPKIVLLLGLYNGVPVKDPMKRLNGILAWLSKNYLSNIEYKDLWVYYNGKPLITILFNPASPCKQLQDYEKPGSLDAQDWTVRWMASQLQINHAESCGMWSWMDGTIRQLVTHQSGCSASRLVLLHVAQTAIGSRGLVAKEVVGTAGRVRVRSAGRSRKRKIP